MSVIRTQVSLLTVANPILQRHLLSALVSIPDGQVATQRSLNIFMLLAHVPDFLIKYAVPL